MFMYDYLKAYVSRPPPPPAKYIDLRNPSLCEHLIPELWDYVVDYAVTIPDYTNLKAAFIADLRYGLQVTYIKSVMADMKCRYGHYKCERCRTVDWNTWRSYKYSNAEICYLCFRCHYRLCPDPQNLRMTIRLHGRRYRGQYMGPKKGGSVIFERMSKGR